jgi:hypothetical protein
MAPEDNKAIISLKKLKLRMPEKLEAVEGTS